MAHIGFKHTLEYVCTTLKKAHKGLFRLFDLIEHCHGMFLLSVFFIDLVTSRGGYIFMKTDRNYREEGKTRVNIRTNHSSFFIGYV